MRFWRGSWERPKVGSKNGVREQQIAMCAEKKDVGKIAKLPFLFGVLFSCLLVLFLYLSLCISDAIPAFLLTGRSGLYLSVGITQSAQINS